MIPSLPTPPLSRMATVVAAVGLVLTLSVAATAHEGGTDGEPSPSDDAAPSEVLIKLAADAGDVDVAALAGVDEVVGTIDGIDVHVGAVSTGTADEVAAALQARPEVAYAEPNGALTLFDEPNDPMFEDQHAPERIGAVDGWTRYREERGYDGFPATDGATIAVIDTGIDLTHPEFAGKIVECRSWLTFTSTGVGGVCQDNNRHGTHVAGIAAATADNGTGIAGIGFDAEIMALQTCTDPCSIADVAAAMVYAADNGADVANFSLGGQTSQTMTDAISHGADAGMLMVAAAGNDGGDVSHPASDDRVVAVSATDADDELAEFSARGPEIDVAAPGVDVLSTQPGDIVYSELSGTSQAAPHVAGLGALLMSLGADAEQARAAITAGAADIGLPADEQGAGLLDVAGSLEAIPGRVSGTVSAAGTDSEPIADATVTATVDGADEPTATVDTGDDGDYKAVLEPATYTVAVDHADYQAESQKATVAAGETATLDFALHAVGSDESVDTSGDGGSGGSDDSENDDGASGDADDDTGSGGSEADGESDGAENAGPQSAAAGVSRVAGRNRFATAAELSQQAYPDGTGVAYVATGEAFPDALAGGVAAAADRAPVLLVTGSQVPSATAAELQRLDVDRVVILGGGRVVGASVESQLADHADTVDRLAGPNRFATAAAVSQAAFGDAAAVDTVYVASGEGFPDALAGVSAAAAGNAPLLLASRSELTAPTEDELARLEPERIVLLGGTATLGDGVADTASLFADTVERLAGPTRFATAAAIARHSRGADVDTVFMATGIDFPDALAAGAVAGAGGAPVLLAAPDQLTDPTRAVVGELAPSAARLLGGPAALSERVERELRDLLGDPAD